MNERVAEVWLVNHPKRPKHMTEENSGPMYATPIGVAVVRDHSVIPWANVREYWPAQTPPKKDVNREKPAPSPRRTAKTQRGRRKG